MQPIKRFRAPAGVVGGAPSRVAVATGITFAGAPAPSRAPNAFGHALSQRLQQVHTAAAKEEAYAPESPPVVRVELNVRENGYVVVGMTPIDTPPSPSTAMAAMAAAVRAPSTLAQKVGRRQREVHTALAPKPKTTEDSKACLLADAPAHTPQLVRMALGEGHVSVCLHAAKALEGFGVCALLVCTTHTHAA
jgi:hypothetical protein